MFNTNHNWKTTQNCITKRYRSNFSSRCKRARQQLIHEKHSIQQLCSKQPQSHIWTCSLIYGTLFPYFNAGESHKSVFVFLFNAFPVCQDTFDRCMSLKYLIFNICFVLRLSTLDRIYSVPYIYCVLLNHKNKPALWKRHLNLWRHHNKINHPDMILLGERPFKMNMLQLTDI